MLIDAFPNHSSKEKTCLFMTHKLRQYYFLTYGVLQYFYTLA